MIRHLPIAGRFEAYRLERIDEPLFPVAALREAVINAIWHRTYNASGRRRQWRDLRRPTRDLQRPRNALIAGVFYRRGLIEQWGRGTEKIVELCTGAGHPEPEFGEQAGSVRVRFLPGGYIESRSVTEDLGGRQREVLDILAEAPRLTPREIRVRMAVPPADRTIREDLLRLKRRGLVGTEGHGRGAHCFLARGVGTGGREVPNRAGIGQGERLRARPAQRPRVRESANPRNPRVRESANPRIRE